MILSVIISFIITLITLGNKLQTQLDTVKLHLTQIMEYLESFTIKFHNFLKDDLKLSYPTDILVFMIMGIVLYYLISLFGRKQNFVYNQPDNPDYSGLLNTVTIIIIFINNV